MNKHFNINYAEQESDWKDLTIIKLLSEVSDLEDRIDKATKILENDINFSELCDGYKVLNILKGSDEE